VAHCLNTHPVGGHDNPDGVVCCQRCDFLVRGAHIGIYEVVSFIGAGSYGYVYKVREPPPLSRILALKVLRLDQFNEQAQANFFREAQRIASMHHPNILPIYNFGQLENEQPYLVMEYAPQTIYDLFRKSDGSKRLVFAEELIPYVKQAADALHYVHLKGLVHQDVKPGNLLIGLNGQLLLSDFGATLHLGTQTHASLGEITGTAVYMSPEHWQGHPRRDSDQYALAICCYELLAGRPPFMYKRLEEMWTAHLNEQPPSPQKWNPRIPAEVAAVLSRALEKDYHRRYKHITEFAESYADAVQVALQRYVCQFCGQQNRSGAQRCAKCGTEQDNRSCAYCDAPVRFGQRCCSACGRLAFPPTHVTHSPLIGVSVRQGRYTIQHVLKHEDTRVMTAVATDAQANEQKVVLKRWDCVDGPLAQRAKQVAHYERVTAPLARFHHPLVPAVLDRFAEGKHYYLVLAYIDGESIEERQQRLLRPLPERDVLGYISNILNVLIALRQQKPPLSHYDLSPSNILIERGRGRAMLTGFQIPHSTTRKLANSPYLPSHDKPPYDQRTAIYELAAIMHHALTNVAPPHSSAYPPVCLLNPQVSPELENILSHALIEERTRRYQSYEEMKKDVQQLL
jgi:serine/threonine protein kinase